MSSQTDHRSARWVGQRVWPSLLARLSSSGLGRVGRLQRGYVLQWAIVVSFIGILVVVPVAVLAGTTFRTQSKVEDNTQAYYATESAVYTVIADLVRGADAFPVPPQTYTPPDVDFGEGTPSVTISELDPKTVSTPEGHQVRALR